MLSAEQADKLAALPSPAIDSRHVIPMVFGHRHCEQTSFSNTKFGRSIAAKCPLIPRQGAPEGGGRGSYDEA